MFGLLKQKPLGGILLVLAGWMMGCGPHRTHLPTTASQPAGPSRQKSPSPADNSYCFVCHVNYQEETLARQHGLAGIGCEQCHGMSARHSADEDNLTAPDVMFAEGRIQDFCLGCHPKEKLIPVQEHASLFTSASSPATRCTECHGEHRLKNRTRRWDKDTGKLLWKDSGPVMDRRP